jgi:hypothetical protein
VACDPNGAGARLAKLGKSRKLGLELTDP